MKNLTPEDLLVKIRKVQKQLNGVKTHGPKSLLSKLTKEEEVKRKKEETRIIKDKASLEATMSILEGCYLKAHERSTRYGSPPKRYSEIFATLDDEITLYERLHASLPSYSDLWKHLKNSPKYKYDEKGKAIINLATKPFDKENMRKNLDNYRYRGRK